MTFMRRDSDYSNLPSIDEIDPESDLTPAEAYFAASQEPAGYGSRANPDDPVLPRPPADARGPRPGPNFRGAVGRIAIVQGQIYLVGAILIAQLFLVTTGLYELLSGSEQLLWWIALAQVIAMLLVLLITLWPRGRVKDF